MQASAPRLLLLALLNGGRKTLREAFVIAALISAEHGPAARHGRTARGRAFHSLLHPWRLHPLRAHERHQGRAVELAFRGKPMLLLELLEGIGGGLVPLAVGLALIDALLL